MPPRLILITSASYDDETIARVVGSAASAVAPGTLAVQLRDKERPREDVRPLADRLRAITRECGALLFVNGDLTLARAIGADGVHLGGSAVAASVARAELGPDAWISCAAHDDEAVRRAIAARASAVLVSPLFDTRSSAANGFLKAGRGLDALIRAHAAAEGRLPIYALGGIDVTNARSCIEAGARGIAVIGAIFEAQDVARATIDLAKEASAPPGA